MAGSRRTLIAAAGGVALLAGAGLAWRRQQPDQPAPGGPAAGGTGDPALADLWGLSFEQPDGQPLAMASLRGKPLIVNFWATWCAPCVREMPLLDRFHKAHAAQGWQVLGLAIDSPTPVREFLKTTPVGFLIGLAGLDGTALVRALGNSQGGLPFSVLIDASGRITQRKLGELHYDELLRWASPTG